MAVYGVALGGNKRNWPGWDNLYASGNTAGRIDYSAHLKNRHKGLPFVWNGAGDDWQNWLHQETPNGELVVGDELITHWISEGTNVEAIYIHNKVAAAGNPTATPPAPPVTIEVSVVDATGAVVGPVTPVALSATGFTKIDVDTLFQTNSQIRVKVTGGDFTTACLAIIADLFNAFDEHPCSCFVPGCEVPTPEPQCFTPSSTC
jgi:hypothetical protein